MTMTWALLLAGAVSAVLGLVQPLVFARAARSEIGGPTAPKRDVALDDRMRQAVDGFEASGLDRGLAEWTARQPDCDLDAFALDKPRTARTVTDDEGMWHAGWAPSCTCCAVTSESLGHYSVTYAEPTCRDAFTHQMMRHLGASGRS